MRFVPYDELDGVPNIVVDGAPSASTILTLSHWPGAPTPPELADDLSAQIAFRYLRARGRYPQPEAVSNNHADEDGLVSVFVLVEPEAALAREARLVEVAAVGDFGTWTDRDGLRAALAVAAHLDEDRSPVAASLTGGWAERTAAAYRAVVPLLPALCDRPERFRPLWEEADAHVAAGLAAIESGAVVIEEVPELDLSVVTVSERWAERMGRRFGVDPAAALPELALHPRIEGFRVLLQQGRRSELRYRYESWVAYRSRPVAPRVPLGPLAERLDAEEPGAVRWLADDVGDIAPRLAVAGDGVSGIAAERVRALVVAHLASGPVPDQSALV